MKARRDDIEDEDDFDTFMKYKAELDEKEGVAVSAEDGDSDKESNAKPGMTLYYISTEIVDFISLFDFSF